MISWRFRHPLIHTRLYSKAAFLNLPSAQDATLLRRSYEPKLEISKHNFMIFEPDQIWLDFSRPGLMSDKCYNFGSVSKKNTSVILF